MNTIKTLILAIIITCSSQVSANTNRPVNELNLVSQQIEKLLIGSDITIYEDITVTITFKINENNKIIVVSNDSNNYDISKFIKSRLNLKALSVEETSKNKFYSIPIKFLSTVDKSKHYNN